MKQARDLPMRDGNLQKTAKEMARQQRPRPSYEGWKLGVGEGTQKRKEARDLPMRDGNIVEALPSLRPFLARDLPMRDGNWPSPSKGRST